MKGFSNTMLHDLLVSRNLSLVSAIIENFDTRIKTGQFQSGDKLAKALVNIFHSKNKGLRLIRWMIHSEIQNGKNSAKTLFRSRSISAKIIPIYGYIIGKDFLKQTLTSSIDMIGKVNSYLDTDVERVGEELAEKNSRALKMLANEFIGKIIFSIRDIPLPIRIIGRAMKKAARRVFPESSYAAINNFIFLRFLVPVITSPEAFGILNKNEKINLTFKRNLIMISKIVQNVGNQSDGFKGSLNCLDDFIKSSSIRILKFYQILTDLTTLNENENPELDNEKYPIQELVINNSLKILKKYLLNNFGDISELLLHSDSRKPYNAFIIDFIENLIEDEDDPEFDSFNSEEEILGNWLKNN
ncbi:ras gtpase-activating protein [Anaeramoeba flamelloides]|nr:ras gtpase-activating protein [Anaeramoeba flamelloides]